MPEPVTLTTLLLAGAATVGAELVKEATKQAYGNLKEKISDLFGGRARKALDKLENSATVEEGKQELERYVGNDLQHDEAAEIQPFLEALVKTLEQDAEAKKVAHSRVGIDVVSGGNAVIRRIKGAREAVVKVRADKDVTIEDFDMDTGVQPGKTKAR